MSVENAKILIIDDDSDILLAAKFILKKYFQKIYTSDTPENLDQIINGQKIDVALLDMNYSAGATSGNEGFEVLKRIKKVSPQTRVIMMTAFGDIDLAIKAIKEGAFDFMVKPWDNTKLVSTIMSAYKKGLSDSNNTPVITPPLHEENHNDIGFTEVTRIFMFLDLKSSTTIAENLGHIRYFELLHDFFRDIANPIVRNKGSIYQYVGDEVVISWSMESGLENNNCINCFFDILNTIEDLSDHYREKYMIVPEFKAGLHYGIVSTGTIGTLKKEIVYTGDVLNTASRIEGLCNHYEVNLLVSENLIEKLALGQHIKVSRIGEINLRGRNTDITLYSLVREANSLQKSI